MCWSGLYSHHLMIRNPPLENHAAILWACLMLKTYCGEPMSNVPIPSHNCYLYLETVYRLWSTCLYSSNNNKPGFWLFWNAGNVVKRSASSRIAQSNFLTWSSPLLVWSAECGQPQSWGAPNISCQPWDVVSSELHINVSQLEKYIFVMKIKNRALPQISD